MAGMSIKDKIKAGALVVDVRTREEFAEEAFPGAVNIPLDEFAARVGELGAKDRPVILYCASGARSAAALRFLKKEGFTDAVNAGGLDSLLG